MLLAKSRRLFDSFHRRCIRCQRIEEPFRFSLDGTGEISYNEPRRSRLNPATLIQDTNGESEHYNTANSIHHKAVTEHKRAYRECLAN